MTYNTINNEHGSHVTYSYIYVYLYIFTVCYDTMNNKHTRHVTYLYIFIYIYIYIYSNAMSINMAAMSPTYTYIYICIYFRSILGHKNNEHGSHVTYKLVGSRSVGSSYVRVCAHPAPKNLPDSQLLLSGFTVCVGFLQGLLELLFHTIYKIAFQNQ